MDDSCTVHSYSAFRKHSKIGRLNNRNGNFYAFSLGGGICTNRTGRPKRRRVAEKQCVFKPSVEILNGVNKMSEIEKEISPDVAKIVASVKEARRLEPKIEEKYYWGHICGPTYVAKITCKGEKMVIGIVDFPNTGINGIQFCLFPGESVVEKRKFSSKWESLPSVITFSEPEELRGTTITSKGRTRYLKYIRECIFGRS